MTSRERSTSSPRRVNYRTMIRSWDDWSPLTKLLSFGYVFRGQADGTLPIESTLYRATKELDEIDRYESERHMLRAFQRRAHHYLPCTPPSDDRLSWLALMQHHGAPTRLIDFTHSFHVGTYFALERTSEKKNDACVIAIRNGLLDEKFFDASSIRTTLEKQRHDDSLRQIFSGVIGNESALSEHSKGVFFGEAEWLSERMSVQQGVFLAAHTLQCSFNENFQVAYGMNLEDATDLPLDTLISEMNKADSVMDFDVIKFVFPRELRSELLKDLASSNVSAASLFPGLDGFARSLNTLVHTAAHEDAMLKDIITDAFREDLSSE